MRYFASFLVACLVCGSMDIAEAQNELPTILEDAASVDLPELSVIKQRYTGHPQVRSNARELRAIIGAERRFPTVATCFVSNYSNITQLDWLAFETATDIDVCVYRVIAAINDQAVAIEWLESIGFEEDARRIWTLESIEDGSEVKSTVIDFSMTAQRNNPFSPGTNIYRNLTISRNLATIVFFDGDSILGVESVFLYN